MPGYLCCDLLSVESGKYFGLFCQLDNALNRCLDNAIADAVTAFASGPDDAISDQAESCQTHLVLADEQRRLIHAAIQAISAIKTSNGGMSGVTGNVLLNAVLELRNAIDQSSPEIRGA